MAPKRVPNANPEAEEVPEHPPSPPPPSEAWRATMQTTAQNTQMLMQMMQQMQANQANQGVPGNQGNFFNQQHHATLNQFLANNPKAFSYYVDPVDVEDWLTDIKKHFECSNVKEDDYVKFAAFQLKDQAADWWQQYKDSRPGQVISWENFCKDFRSHHIPTSVIEGMREQFRNLKQGSMTVYQYNVKFQNLARYAKQDIPDTKSKIYQFRGGLKDELQLALTLFEPEEFDKFYNMALKQEAAQLKMEASKKRIRDVVHSSSSSQMVSKHQKFWLPPPPVIRAPYNNSNNSNSNKNSGGRGFSHPPNPSNQSKNQFQSQGSKSSGSHFRPLSEVVCNKCGQKGHYANRCPNPKRLPPPPPVSSAIVKHNPKQARVNLMSAAQAENSSDVILGNLRVNSIPAKVLFDSGASLSFISRPFVAKHELVSESIPRPLKIISPGLQMTSNSVVPDVSIHMGDYRFLASLVILGNSDIDLILGMDWLSQHDAHIDCANKEVKITHSNEDMIIFASRDNTIWLFSLNDKGEINAISQIPVVNEYQDVFPEELPGMPPHRQVEFVIELEPGTEPACRRLYKLSLDELKELKKQLDK